MQGAKGRGVKEKVAERVFELMEKFAGYGFNKAARDRLRRSSRTRRRT